MALTNINDNFQLDAPKHLDNRVGNYSSVAEANASIPQEYRVQGLEVVVITAGQAVKYYYRDGVADGDLIIMPTGGGGSVAFADITGQPSDNANLDAVLDLKGDMFKSVYDTDDDGVVDRAETIQILVRNSTGSTLSNGKVVYLSGATGNRPNAILASASSEATSSKTIGIVVADILDNADGYIAVNGSLHNLNLSAFAAGDMLWLSETAGDYVANTPPAEPAHAVFIGYVARAHPTEGRMVIAIQNGYELGELHGVEITSPATDHYLYYASDGLWKNRALTKTEVGLSNVDNTSDADKPISSATQTALNSKVNSNSAITGATKTKITYDSKGLVTAGADIAIADLPTTLPVGYSSPVVSIVSGGVITETQLTTITIPAGAFKNGDNILSTFWATRTSGAATGINTALIIKITNSSGTQICSVSTGNRHNNFNLIARVLSDTSIIWYPNSATASAVTTTTPSLSSNGFTIYIGITRTNTTDEVTLYNSIIRKYS